MRRSTAALVSAMVLAGGLGLTGTAAAASSGSGSGHALNVPGNGGLPAGVMPVGGSDTIQNANDLIYRGGPVVSNANVVSAQWQAVSGTRTYTNNPGIDSFMAGLMHSSYMSWLDEYDTPGNVTNAAQHIGYGTFGGRFVMTPSDPTDAFIDDTTDLQPLLLSEVGAGHLPAPTLDSHGNVNTIYAVFLPQQVVSTRQGSSSGVQYCAYHGTTTGVYHVASADKDVHLLYALMPDPNSSGLNTGGCGAGPAAQYEQSYVSHELTETITDPLVGLAVDTADTRLGWYNDTQGEISDICNGQQATISGGDGSGTIAQKNWSNSQAACIIERPAATPDAPSGLTAAQGTNGEVDLSWAAPDNDGFSPVMSYEIFRSTTSGDLSNSVGNIDWSDPEFADVPPSDGIYFYDVVASNGAHTSTAAETSINVDTVAPVAALAGPANRFSLATSLSPTYSATDGGTGIASYDVRYRKAAWDGSFGSYSSPASWVGTHATTRTLAVTPGHDYCFSVRATDHAGNVSAYSAEKCTAVLLDDRKFPAAADWTRQADSSAYADTITKTRTRGATLLLAGAHFRTVTLLVTTCAGCGHAKVYAGKHLLGTIDTHSASTHHMVPMTFDTLSLRTKTIRVKAIDADSSVIVDGIGISEH